MARKLFGTDGIRGVAGEYPLDRATIYATGLAVGHDLRKTAAEARVLLGRDTRESSPWIAATLAIGGVAVWLATRTHHGPGKLVQPPPPKTRSQVQLCQSCAFGYNPLGEPHSEHPDAPLAIDSDPSTAWTTQDYYSGQLLKAGVGIYVDAKPGTTARDLVVDTTTPGFTAQIYVRNSPPSDAKWDPGPNGWNRAPRGCRTSPGGSATATPRPPSALPVRSATTRAGSSSITRASPCVRAERAPLPPAHQPGPTLAVRQRRRRRTVLVGHRPPPPGRASAGTGTGGVGPERGLAPGRQSPGIRPPAGPNERRRKRRRTGRTDRAGSPAGRR